MEKRRRLAVSNVISTEPMLPFPLISNSHQNMLDNWTVYDKFWLFFWLGLCCPEWKINPEVSLQPWSLWQSIVCIVLTVSWEFVHKFSKLLLQCVQTHTLSFLTGCIVLALHFQNCSANSQSVRWSEWQNSIRNKLDEAQGSLVSIFFFFFVSHFLWKKLQGGKKNRLP